MQPKDGEAILKFLHEAEKLKTLLRHSWLSNGRRESVAEHTWRMTLMALLLQPYLKKVDLLKSLKLTLVHDLGEIHASDFPAFKKQPANKAELERRGLLKLTKPLPPLRQKEILELWEEYEAAKTPEARFAKALDKTEVLLQHNEADIKFMTKKEFAFNLYHGKDFTDGDKILSLFRELINKETIMHYKKYKINKDLYKNWI